MFLDVIADKLQEKYQPQLERLFCGSGHTWGFMRRRRMVPMGQPSYTVEHRTCVRSGFKHEQRALLQSVTP